MKVTGSKILYEFCLNFRLWLTAESHLKFSTSLLESCLKVTYESPPGIKRNLQRTLNGWSPSVFEGSESVTKVMIRLFSFTL